MQFPVVDFLSSERVDVELSTPVLAVEWWSNVVVVEVLASVTFHAACACCFSLNGAIVSRSLRQQSAVRLNF
jgi:hypothetical protein